MTATAEIQALKEAHRKTWASGDYPRVAELVTDVGERIVERGGVKPGSEVLDVAAGTGNAAIPAARAGAHVVAIDLTSELFLAGRRRALDAGVEIEWITADAETSAGRHRGASADRQTTVAHLSQWCGEGGKAAPYYRRRWTSVDRAQAIRHSHR